MTSIHSCQDPKCGGGSEKQGDLKNVSGTADSTAARNGMERQGLWCRLYVSNNQCPCTMRYKRYRTMSERRGGKQCDWSIQFTRRSLSTERAIKCVHLVKNGRKQPECGQPGYAVVCYTSHLPYTTRYILPDYVRGGRDENSAARQGQFQTRWPK